MKVILIFISGVFYFSSLFSQIPDYFHNCQQCNSSLTGFAYIPQCNPYYALAFNDEFEKGYLDLSKWNLIEGVPRAENYWTDPNYVTFVNQNFENYLDIKQDQETKVHNYYFNGAWHTNTFNYSSGEIQSKYFFGYGVYEIRCKLPTMQNNSLWPAFWTFGGDYITKVWDEIDIFEFNSQHYNNYTGYVVQSYNDQTMTLHHDCDNDGQDEGVRSPSYTAPYDHYFETNFHRFIAVHTPWVTTWYTGGSNPTLVGQVYNYIAMTGQAVDCAGIAQSPFGPYAKNCGYPNGPMQIIVGCGFQYGNDAPGIFGPTSFPTHFQIDYIRYYKPLFYDCSYPFTLVDNSLFNSFPGYYNYFNSMSNVTVQGNVSLSSNQVLVLEAGQNVIIESEFVAEYDSEFIAQINAASCAPPDIIPNPGGSGGDPMERNMNGSTEPVEYKVPRSSFNIYCFPNPTDDILNLIFENGSQNYEVTVTDIVGKQLLHDAVKVNEYKLSLGSFSPGNYIIKIYDKSAGEIRTKKIVVK